MCHVQQDSNLAKLFGLIENEYMELEWMAIIDIIQDNKKTPRRHGLKNQFPYQHWQSEVHLMHICQIVQ